MPMNARKLAASILLGVSACCCHTLSALEPVSIANRNLLRNGGFDVDLAGWTVVTPEAEIASGWVYDPIGGSGAVAIRKSVLTQCVAATPLRNYRFGGRVRGTSDPNTGKARIELIFLSKPGCPQPTDENVVASETLEVDVRDDWQSLSETIPSAPQTASALVRLSVLDTSCARFDDVFLTPGTRLTSTRIKPEQYDKITPGMTFADVVSLLGQPNNVFPDDEGTLAIYGVDDIVYFKGKPQPTLHMSAEFYFDQSGRLTTKQLSAK